MNLEKDKFKDKEKDKEILKKKSDQDLDKKSKSNICNLNTNNQASNCSNKESIVSKGFNTARNVIAINKDEKIYLNHKNTGQLEAFAVKESKIDEMMKENNFSEVVEKNESKMEEVKYNQLNALIYQNEISKNLAEKAEKISPVITLKINPQKEEQNSLPKASKLEFSSQQSTKLKDENIDLIQKKLSEEISDKMNQNNIDLKFVQLDSLSIISKPHLKKIKLDASYSDKEKHSNDENKSSSQRRFTINIELK